MKLSRRRSPLLQPPRPPKNRRAFFFSKYLASGPRRRGARESRVWRWRSKAITIRVPAVGRRPSSARARISMRRGVRACNLRARSIRPGELAAGDRLRAPAGARPVPADRINVKTFQTTAILGRNCSRETLLTCFNLHFQLPRGGSHFSFGERRAGASVPHLPPTFALVRSESGGSGWGGGVGVRGQGSAASRRPKVKVTTGEVSLECGLHLGCSRESRSIQIKKAGCLGGPCHLIYGPFLYPSLSLSARSFLVSSRTFSPQSALPSLSAILSVMEVWPYINAEPTSVAPKTC